MCWGELKLGKVPWGDRRLQTAHACASGRSDRRASARRSKRSAGRPSVQVILRDDPYMAFCTCVYQQIPSGSLARSQTVEVPHAFKLPKTGFGSSKGTAGESGVALQCLAVLRSTGI